MTPVEEKELQELEQSKAMFDKWFHDLSQAAKPLIVKDGKVIQGTYWIGVKGGKAKAKRLTEGQKLEKWACRIANKAGLEGYDIDLTPVVTVSRQPMLARVKRLCGIT